MRYPAACAPTKDADDHPCHGGKLKATPQPDEQHYVSQHTGVFSVMVAAQHTSWAQALALAFKVLSLDPTAKIMVPVEGRQIGNPWGLMDNLAPMAQFGVLFLEKKRWSVAWQLGH